MSLRDNYEYLDPNFDRSKLIDLDYEVDFDPDFGPDPYFEESIKRGKLSCSEKQFWYVSKVIWPVECSFRRVLVAQDDLIKFTTLGLFAVGDRDLGHLGRGHVLYEDDPGKGKTLLATIPSKVLGGRWERFQGANDNVPADLIGGWVVDVDENDKRYFRFVPGAAFADFLLLDEINRNTPSFLGGALLELLGEGKVTSRGITYSTRPFAIMTMNWIEAEGTYRIPPPLLDRTMFKIIGRPFTAEEYAEILERTSSFIDFELKQVCDVKLVDEIRMFIHQNVYVSKLIRQSMGRFITISHNPAHYLQWFHEKFQAPIVLCGISARGATHWEGAAKVHAFRHYRNYVLPEDVKEVLLPVFRHRIVFAPSVLEFFSEELVKTDPEDLPEPLRKILKKTLAQFDKINSSITADIILRTLIKEAW
jgi:MoxR-like ATPase